MAHNELLETVQSNEVNIGKNERIASMASGAFMLIAGMRGLSDKPFRSTASMIAGGFLLVRGMTGHCLLNSLLGRNTALPDANRSALEITETIRVNRPRNEVYTYWRMLENLPEFMKHLKSVEQFDEIHSHWEARLPGGIGTLKWDATIIHELANEVIAWRSDEGALIENAGEIEFISLPGDATEIRASISYRPPAGQIGLEITAMFNDTFERMIREDLQRFRIMAESHELRLSTAESHAQLE